MDYAKINMEQQTRVWEYLFYFQDLRRCTVSNRCTHPIH